MPQSDDYRKYLETCFKHMEDHFKEIKETQKETNEHLKTLNGTVADHAKYIVYADGVIDTRKKEMEDFSNKIDSLDKKISQIDEDLIEYKLIKKYPKIATYVFGIAMFLAVVGFVNTTASLRKVKSEVDMVKMGVQKSCVKIDSLINIQ